MKIYINNKRYEIKNYGETTILQALHTKHLQVPRFCYHEKLAIAGNCRMCFVELPKSKKPVLSCATAIQDGIELYTNTFVVNKSQESVLEFLLINHPLDCPICDQAGECDLQELTKNFGSDRGRFAEMKRSVEDIQLGSAIKTIMTRCIHCTRCVRYADEVLKIPNIGTSGRGRDTEISTYVNRIMKSELSGNVVDLCPVGALTSKPYAFKSRPWELRRTESIDILDSIGSSITLNTKNNQIMRVLPKPNDQFNEEWITDKSRYSYDSFPLQRITSPFISVTTTHKIRYIAVTWSFLLEHLSSTLSYFWKCSNSTVNTGSLLDLMGVLSSKYLSKYLETDRRESSDCNVDRRADYIIPNSMEYLEGQSLYYFINTNMDYDSPITKLKVQKLADSKTFKIIGSYWNTFLPNSNHLSSTLKLLIRLIKGSTEESYFIFKKNNLEIFYKVYANLKNNIRCLLNNMSSIPKNNKKYYLSSFLEIINLNPVHNNHGPIHSSELGNLNSYLQDYSNTKITSDIKSINFNIGGHSYEANKDAYFNIFIGHHRSNYVNDDYNFILPSVTFVESSLKFIDNLGTVKYTNKAIGKLGKTKTFISLIGKLLKGIGFFKLYEICKSFNKTYSRFPIKSDLLNGSLDECLKNHLSNSLYKKTLYLYYASDLYTFSSPNMMNFISERNTYNHSFYSEA